MKQQERVYIAIDLKSFFASVECVERGLNPLSTNLVVADESRTEKTICLAVSPSLKAYGIAGRARLFEVVQRVRQVNSMRRQRCYTHCLTNKSWDDNQLAAHDDWAIDYIIAPPRMAKYIDYSVRVYGVYLKYISAEDIHVYSIDEVFIDATPYLTTYKMTAHQLAMTLIKDVLEETGITATAGIGTNLYLAKVAMDVVAKHLPADEDGVRIASLNEMTYRETLWAYTPITKFWRVGKGIARKLQTHGIYTMGDVAKQSVRNEELLYDLFGVNAELLIDHAWGWEPCTLADIKAYKPATNSLSRGQVLQEPYDFEKTRVVLYEMTENLALTLLDKNVVTNQLTVDIGYDKESLNKKDFFKVYKGDIVTDHYGRSVPKPAHFTVNIATFTSVASEMIADVLDAYDNNVNSYLLVRRITLTANNVVRENDAPKMQNKIEQLDLFTDYEMLRHDKEAQEKKHNKQRKLQQTILQIKKEYGKNAILKGINFAKGATMIERNKQIGGHKA
mgnify:CR=1 FL=1